MAHPPTHPILAQLRSARTISEQTAALRALKNDIVGYVQRKEAWVELQVLEPIVHTIASQDPAASSNRKQSGIRLIPCPLSEEEETRLQALQLVASFAHGGACFLKPIIEAGALPGILSNISPYTNDPCIVVAALRALTNIANAAEYADSSSPHDKKLVASQIFVPEHLESLNAILTISSGEPQLQTQLSLTAGLIARLCHEEKHQHALTMAGLLDSLAARLASFAVRDGFVLPGAAGVAQHDGLFAAFPPPAQSNSRLGPILEAIVAIIGESKYRATRLVHSPSILAVFPCLQPFQDSDQETPGSCRHLSLTAMECFLPEVPRTFSRKSSDSRHPFGATPGTPGSQSSNKNNKSCCLWDPSLSQPKTSDSESEEIESPLIPWLILQVRSRTDYESLMAASVLTCLFKAGLGSRRGVRKNGVNREHTIGLLVVPVLIDMLVKAGARNVNAASLFKAHNETRIILEHAPLVLARLIADCEFLQNAASDCGAVKLFARLLKRAYSPIDGLDKTKMWSATVDTDMDIDTKSLLGPPGQSVAVSHLIALRESSLKAVAALAAGKEDYRKQFIKEDTFIYVVESLKEFPRKPQPPPKSSNGNGRTKDTDRDDSDDEAPLDTVDPKYGQNTASVFMAACHVTRMFSRSISILRTAIVDHNVAAPIFQFLSHPDINVRIAATGAMANLVMDVSPTRETLSEMGVMAKLCEQAHSHDPMIRLNSMWALKHFVDAVGPELKRACLEELDPDWLLQLIDDDAQETNSMHDVETIDEDMIEDPASQPPDEPHKWVCGTNGSFIELNASLSTRMRQSEDRLAIVREAELNPLRQARNNDVAIQEQALDFIRNFIGRPPPGSASDISEATQMIDYLFTHLGQEALFTLLTSKLRSKVLNLSSSRGPNSDSRVVYPQPQLIVPVIYVLVHIAASDSRHRSMITSQTELLKLLAQQSTHKDREVRLSLCHLVNNLTWVDESHDHENCFQRASELSKAGFFTKLERLEKEDRDLDVRERARTAMDQVRVVTSGVMVS